MNPIFTKEHQPPPFPQGEPGFVRELKKHQVFRPHRDDSAAAPQNTVSILNGIKVESAFPDPEHALDTAFFDLDRFLGEAGLPKDKGLPVRFRKSDAFKGEDFSMRTAADAVTVEAGETEGIRRAVYYVMDRIAELRIPYLPIGTQTKHYWLKNRISRCFFGPIKRPPFNIDELMNDIDYYPDEYLSRLAHEGVNGLWLTITFKDICKTTINGQSPDAPKRLAKLRKTVNQCLRYGIKTWVFCIEPRAWLNTNPCPEGAPELQGPGTSYALNSGCGYERSFCPNSATAEKYLYESAYSLFSEVPGLGGMLTVSHGERTTSCLSTLSKFSLDGKVKCDKQCNWLPADIIAHTLGPLARGIRDANPKADLISWLYQPDAEQLAPWIYTLPSKLPESVSLAYNFESGVTKNQLGRVRAGGDYWLSCAGPSDRFSRMAEAARHSKCGFAAKLQVSCSHEDAAVPYIPAPGLLYEKYRAMKNLGVEHAVMCWYFGNYPGLMNRAAGLLACDEFQDSEMEFLQRLAAPEWPGKEQEVAQVWKTFEEAYGNYPLDKQFQYYGPVHDGAVWPLHLKRARRQLTRSWKPDAMPAGDTLGESMQYQTVGEITILLEKMSRIWSEGCARLEEIARDYRDDAVCADELSVAEAIRLQFECASDIFRFYQMRASLFEGAADAGPILDDMEKIVRKEIANAKALAELCEKDPRLGYHSEAEVFKYYPAKLYWRAGILEDIVLKDFAECRQALAAGRSFREFAECRDTEECRTGSWYQNGKLKWKAQCTSETLNVEILCENSPDADEEYMKLYAMDEEGLTFPYIVNTGLARHTSERSDWTCCCRLEKQETANGWKVEAEIPRALFRGKNRILFGVERIEYIGTDERATPYPAGEFRNELRLNLSYFMPDKLVLLHLDR